MPLVQVVDGRLVPERPQRAHPGDADHDLLPDPLLAVDRVQPRNERVRLEQIQRDTSHVDYLEVTRSSGVVLVAAAMGALRPAAGRVPPDVHNCALRGAHH